MEARKSKTHRCDQHPAPSEGPREESLPHTAFVAPGIPMAVGAAMELIFDQTPETL